MFSAMKLCLRPCRQWLAAGTRLTGGRKEREGGRPRVDRQPVHHMALLHSLLTALLRLSCLQHTDHLAHLFLFGARTLAASWPVSTTGRATIIFMRLHRAGIGRRRRVCRQCCRPIMLPWWCLSGHSLIAAVRVAMRCVFTGRRRLWPDNYSFIAVRSVVMPLVWPVPAALMAPQHTRFMHVNVCCDSEKMHAPIPTWLFFHLRWKKSFLHKMLVSPMLITHRTCNILIICLKMHKHKHWTAAGILHDLEKRDCHFEYLFLLICLLLKLVLKREKQKQSIYLSHGGVLTPPLSAWTTK